MGICLTQVRWFFGALPKYANQRLIAENQPCKPYPRLHVHILLAGIEPTLYLYRYGTVEIYYIYLIFAIIYF